jgi:hypothetical protein
MVPGTGLASREEFAGTLSGDYVDHGDPPWRWYLLTGPRPLSGGLSGRRGVVRVRNPLRDGEPA